MIQTKVFCNATGSMPNQVENIGQKNQF